MIKVLIVDDSVVFRKILQEALSKHPRIRVVGTAVNGRDALNKIPRLRPHLLVLDVEMPEMDGLRTLEELKRRRLDVGAIMFSTLTSQGADTTLEALSRGAFDFTPKPTGQGAFAESVRRIEQELIPKILAFGETLKQRPGRVAAPGGAPRAKRPAVQPRVQPAAGRTAAKGAALKTKARPVLRRLAVRPEVVVIGVSTGGPNALNSVIPLFPANFNLPILLVQHMPPVFTTQLARRLNEKSKLQVVEAKDRERIRPGTVYIAPGDFHMVVKDTNGKVIRLNQDPPVNSCRPSVDVLFESAAEVYGGRVVAVIMTGMGHDGLDGCKRLKEKGAMVVAQNRETCVVWGMPRFVEEAGLADRVCPLDQITPTVLELCGFNRMAGGCSMVRR